MAANRLYLVAGLGNPGAAYRETRHNTGFFVVEALAADAGIPLTRRKFDACYGRGTVDGVPVVLAKPQAFMNRSGAPLARLAYYFNVTHQDVLVIHDDIDLAFGRLKIKEKGGHGGHKGVESVMDAFGEDRFVRLRVGVGRAEGGTDAVNHVLGRFSPAERPLLGPMVDRAREAAVCILCRGAREAMNRFNSKNTLNNC